MISTRPWTWALALAVATSFAAAGPAHANIIINNAPGGGSPFGPNGDVGFGNGAPGSSISFGSDNHGQIAQLDSFVNMTNLPNSGGAGTSFQLGIDGPPPGVGYAFSYTQPTSAELQLSYSFTNNTGGVLTGFQFLSYVDPFNTNKFGSVDPKAFGTEAGALGTIGSGGKIFPTSFQIDDPNGTIYTNLLNPPLDNTNHRPTPDFGDAALAIGITYGDLAAGATLNVTILLADDLTTLGGKSLTSHGQTTTDLYGQTLTLSGFVTVPEPSSIVLSGIGLAGVGVVFGRRVRRG